MNKIVKEIAKNGQAAYKHNNKYIYSSYNPANEAKKYLNTLPEIKKYVISCCGADYINSALLDKNVDLILSFEPLVFEDKITSERILRLSNIEEIEIILLGKNIHAKDISLIVWQPLIEALPQIYLEPLKKLKDILFKSSISANTQKAFGFKESFNFLINALTINTFSYLKKTDKKHKSPAIIISSGASLKDNIDFIKDVEDRAFLFSLPSALPYLQHNNISPDFVIAVDPGYGTYYHLAKYRNKINLLSPLTITPSIFRLNNINPVIFNYCTYLEDVLFDNLKIAAVPAEGTVFINLLRMLPQMGFSDVILIGQDFGYKDNRSHINEGSFELEYSQNASYYKTLEGEIKKIETAQETEYLETPDKKIKTNFALKLYYEHFIKKDFDINIYLPDACFNPLSENIQKMSSNYVIDKYEKKEKLQSILKIDNYEDLNSKKKYFFKLLKELNNDIDNKELSKIIDDIFIDKNNENHLNKLKKLVKALN